MATTQLFRVIARDALISEDGLYRYWLSRTLEAVDPNVILKGRVIFVALNPSVANAVVDDATVRKCMGFAFRWGFREVVIVNLFAFRATNPKKLLAAVDPVGPANVTSVQEAICGAGRVVVAWGSVPRRIRTRAEPILALLGTQRNLECLGRTKGGAPKHPVRLGYGSVLEAWNR